MHFDFFGEQSLSVTRTGTEGNQQGYEIFWNEIFWGMKFFGSFMLGYETKMRLEKRLHLLTGNREPGKSHHSLLHFTSLHFNPLISLRLTKHDFTSLDMNSLCHVMSCHV